jgi:CarD family transcriptional regulator
MYEIGDYIVKATDGVCRVEDITHLDMAGVDKNKEYYVLIPVYDQAGKIYASCEVINGNTRRVMSEEEAWDLIHKIPNIEIQWVDNDKQRQEKYKRVVKQCDPESLVEVIKMTYMRKHKRMAQGKKNTAVDEHYFHVAEEHLYSELGFALHKEKDEISTLIKETIGSSKE